MTAPRYTYRVIYLWQGERHSLLEQPEDPTEALALVEGLRAKRFKAWIEPVLAK